LAYVILMRPARREVWRRYREARERRKREREAKT
jgi:hypothetical protein